MDIKIRHEEINKSIDFGIYLFKQSNKYDCSLIVMNYHTYDVFIEQLNYGTVGMTLLKMKSREPTRILRYSGIEIIRSYDVKQDTLILK